MAISWLRHRTQQNRLSAVSLLLNDSGQVVYTYASVVEQENFI